MSCGFVVGSQMGNLKDRLKLIIGEWSHQKEKAVSLE